MTIEEFDTLKFRCTGHVSAKDYHTATYINSDYGIMIISQCNMRDGEPYGRESKRFVYNGKRYSQKKFYEVLKDIEYKGCKE